MEINACAWQADGSEEIEALTLADVLVRAGVRVTIAAVGGKPQNVVTMSRGAKVQADVAIEACVDRAFDLIVVPGVSQRLPSCTQGRMTLTDISVTVQGMPGAANLRDSEALTTLLKQQKHADKLYGAICAAPAVVLHAHGLLPVGGAATSYPSFEAQMTGVQYQKTARVVVEGKCVTSQGPATAMEMGVKLVELLCGESKAQEVAKGLLMAGY